jgi:UDP-glucose:(heptosyl)LPS alpha-1,3-glucosyltransferase
MNFEIKRLSLLIRGVARCSETGNENPRLKLLVLGKGKQDKYLTLAHELGIADRIIFAGVTQEVEKYYLASDIFAMPSRFDTFGLAVLEAMAAGLPVIITRTVGARDLIDSGTQGFVLPADPSPLGISEKLLFLMDDNHRMRMGENAREVAQRHTWDQRADQIAELYFNIAS